MVKQTSNIEVKLHEEISQKLMEIKLDSQSIEENLRDVCFEVYNK